MRGFPFFNLLLCLLLSGALLLPLVLRATQHTQPAATPALSAAQGPEQTLPVLVTVKFVHAPLSLTLSAAGKALADWKNDAGELRWEDSLPLPADGKRVEFSLAAAWPAGTPDTVAEVTLEPEGLAAQTQNVWSTGAAADEIISGSWEGGQ